MVIMILNTHMLKVKKTITSCYIEKYNHLQDYETSTVKNEYLYLYKKNEEITNDPEESDIVNGDNFFKL